MLKKIESFIVTDSNYSDAVAFFHDRLGLEMPSKGANMARF
jgi:hypothetical protein